MGLPVNIDSIKSTINRRGGAAIGNRYAVYVAHPSKSVNSLLKYDPATSLNNLISSDGVKIGDFITDPRDLFLLCQTCTLPGKRILTTESTHNHNLSKKPYSMMTEEVAMTFLLTNDYYIKKYFDLWQEIIVDSTHEHYKTFYKRDYTTDVVIQQLSGASDTIPGYTVKLENAYPIQLSSIELGNASEGLLEISITWEYDNWRVIDNFDVATTPAVIPDDGMLEKLKEDKKISSMDEAWAAGRANASAYTDELMSKYDKNDPYRKKFYEMKSRYYAKK